MQGPAGQFCLMVSGAIAESGHYCFLVAASFEEPGI